jgi:signal transduction histidine kinase
MTIKSLKQILPLLLLMLLPLPWGCSSTKDAAPLARQGVIDLSAVDLLNHAPVRLDGEWEFYWKQLLAPEDFRTGKLPAGSAFLSLPAAWNNVKLNGEPLGGAGYATFRLRIVPGTVTHELALRLDDVYSAYKLWANGKLLVTNGHIGGDQSGETLAQAIRLPRLTIDSQPMELVLQVSNHHYREGGIVSSIELGAAEKLEAQQHRQWGLALFCVGSLLIMGIYHIVLYCFRRKDSTPVYFGCYCLLWMIYILFSNSSGWVVLLFVEKIPEYLAHRLDMFGFIISVPVGYGFFRKLYPDEFSRRMQHVISSMALLFVVLGLACTTMTFTTVIPAYYLFSMVMILYCFARLYTAMRRGREGATFILLGFLALGLVGINDMLCDLQLVRSVYLLHIGMFVFILFQAVALSLRFSRAFTKVEHLSDELSEKNLSLEEEMAERNRLEREIVNVSEEERRHISHDLHDGLCQQLTGARLRCSVLERKLAGSGEGMAELAQLSTLLEESVNQAYDLSRGLWPVEQGPQGFGPSLEELTHRLVQTSRIAVQFRHANGCADCHNANLTQLYRIAQEAITNAVKHARPKNLEVTLRCRPGESVSLIVHDDGIGRQAASGSPGGMGMRIMAHRARMIGGFLQIADADPGGTVVTCTIPCN